MDVRNPTSKDNKIMSKTQASEPVIRTMKEDLALLEKRPKKFEPKTKKPAPPSELPVIESIRPLEIKKRIEETRKKLEEERERLRKPDLAKTEKKEAPKVDKIERIRDEKREATAKFEKKPIAPPAPSVPPAPKVASEQRNYLPYAVAGLVVILIITGIGGFFYWRSLRSEPVAVVIHKECQESLCIEVEGEGQDECSIDEDCIIAKPPVIPSSIPSPLVSVDSKETIELKTSEKNVLLKEIKWLAQEEEGKVKQILIKITDEGKDEYLDLNGLVSALGLKLPAEILGSVKYTLFLSGQSEGNRLGLIIALEQDLDISEILKNWETTMPDDLFSLLLTDDVPEPATEEFQSNTYQEVDIRYINLSTPDLTIDYAVIEHNLILTSSRESMYQIIDRLTGG